MPRALVLGGARSGKSGYGEHLIAEWATSPDEVRYIATSQRRSDDPEWDSRIAAHQKRRPEHWQTIESIELTEQLRLDSSAPTLVDDLGTWLAAQIDARGAWGRGPESLTSVVDELVEAVVSYTGPLVLVTPEVGMGIVPATPSGRMFRDLIGVLNGRLAEKCEKVVLVIAGIPLPLR